MNRVHWQVGFWLAIVRLATGAPPPPPSPGVRFHEHVAPLLFEHCASCHRPGGSAPFPLLSFSDARKHARELADVTARRYMPPWLPAPNHGEFVGERRLNDEQVQVFQDWLAAGTPEGDPARSPPVPTWSSEWELGPPDLIAKMPRAYTVPPAGGDVYRHFVIPVELPRRRYVKAWQFRPQSRAVHHAFLRLDRSREARRRDAIDPEPGFPGMDTPNGVELPGGHFSSWQPGAVARQIPPGLSWAIDPGADLVVQMHLRPLGRAEPLGAEVALYFTDQPPTNQPMKVALGSFDIDLPPGKTNAVVTDEFTLPAVADLLALLPHTHYLGRRIEARAHLPGGVQRSLLLIPEWDFNWQGDYVYRTPLRLPAGTRVVMEITFDNSTNNLRNPFNPPRRVEYGPNTIDEMAEVWLQLLPASPADAKKLAEANFDRTLRDSYAVNERRLRSNPNDGPALVNLGRVLLARQRTEEARQRFAQAVSVAPHLDDAHYYLGLTFRVNGQLDQAIAEFTRAIELNPMNARAHGNLGLAYLATERLDASASHLAEAVRLDPNDQLALATLGAIRLDQGRYAEAEPLLARALILQPGDSETRRFLEMARKHLPSPPPRRP